MTVLQASLLDLLPVVEGPADDLHARDLLRVPGPRAFARAPERTYLADGAWVDYLPEWFAGSDELCTRLIASVPWASERRRMYDRMVDVPRLVCFYGGNEILPETSLDAARAALNGWYGPMPGEDLRTVGMCWYRDGRDSVAWHGDTIGRGATADTMVAIVSMGERRGFLLRPRGGGKALRYEVGRGDLLVMGGSCQRTWEHSVPKTSRAVGPRVSVQFRPLGVR